MMTADPRVTATAGGWRLEHSYATLPAMLHAAVDPTPVRAPRLVLLNRNLAKELGLDAEALAGAEGAAWLSGNTLPPGAAPLAQAYAGHQYGHFTTLGDGRALLLGEQIAPTGARHDIQLKGSGPTPYSRRGDGRAALGPMLREYLISEAMAALGIPTTRSLAVVATGESVWRETALPGAVLTRVATSHLRVGTFEWAAAHRDEAALRALVAYALERHYPERAEAENPALALLAGVVARQAALVARWMLVGFVHGVMNTDNMAISGETIDYGPCAFMDGYDPATVFSSIDRHGRYAYGNQPAIAQWNLARLAEALLPVLHPVEADAIATAKGVLEGFGPQFQGHMLAGLRRKLGLFTEEGGDAALIDALLAWMEEEKADFTNTFAALSAEEAGAGERIPAEPSSEAFADWKRRWRERLSRQSQSTRESVLLRRANNPAVIPRNQRVEAALAAAVDGDLTPIERLLDVLATPYDHERDYTVEDRVPAEGAEPYRTFCGT